MAYSDQPFARYIYLLAKEVPVGIDSMNLKENLKI